MSLETKHAFDVMTERSNVYDLRKKYDKTRPKRGRMFIATNPT